MKGADDGTRLPRVAGPTELLACHCFRCLDAPEHGFNNPTMQQMILCPACGNKRCPRASDHRFACTGSNALGQDGSRYGTPWEGRHAAALVPLIDRIAKGRTKYPSGCTALSLLDEVGEFAHAINKRESPSRVRDELLDVAAVAMRLYFGEVDTDTVVIGLAQPTTGTRKA